MSLCGLFRPVKKIVLFDRGEEQGINYHDGQRGGIHHNVASDGNEADNARPAFGGMNEDQNASSNDGNNHHLQNGNDYDSEPLFFAGVEDKDE